MKTLVLAFCAFVVHAVAAEEAWQKYTNARFGFSVERPASLVASREPDNGAGQEFHTKNNEFSLLAHGHFLGIADQNETIETYWLQALKDAGNSVTYKRKAADWYVLSGVKDGTEFYYKFAVKENNWAEIRITYPHAKSAKYDPWVERISKSFVPFLRGDFDRFERIKR